MSPRTTLTMSNGKGIDLLEPKAIDIDFVVIAEHLAKDNRYCGATNGVVYSVAEHSVRCADAALRQTNDGTLAAYLLCHDMHEAFLGDDTTPKKQAIGRLAEIHFGVLADHIKQTFDLLTYRFDIAIHAAAGLQWPPPSGIGAAIKRWDRILLATEWRDLMRCDPPYQFDQEPLSDIIEPMAWQDAASLFHERCKVLLPDFDIHQKLIHRGEAS